MHQEEMIHFRYLMNVEGGLLHMAPDIDTHLTQLSAAVALDGARDERNRRFVSSFIRPNGLDAAATPAFADALERVQQQGTTPDPSLEAGAWLRPVAIAAASWSRTGVGRWLMNDMRTDVRDEHEDRTERLLQSRRTAKDARIRAKAVRKARRQRRDAIMLKAKEAKSALRTARFRTAMFAHRVLALAGIGRGDWPGSGQEHR
jgi:hypothetical protein